MTLSTVGTVKLGTDVNSPMAIGHVGRDIVVLPTQEPGAPSWNTVTVVDPAAGTSRAVAHSAWPRGLINWVATTGDWVVYTDQSHRQGDGSYEALWRIEAIDLVTGSHRTLASSGRKESALIPVVQAQDGLVLWTAPEADRSAKELVWNPGSAAPYAVLRHKEMTPDSVTIDDGWLYYLGPNGLGRKGHTVGGDCWRVPLTGGTPVAVTHTALAMGCAARGSHLVWSQHIDPETPNPPPNDGILDNPYSLWTETINADTPSAPVKIDEGYNGTYQLHPVEHALVWQQASAQVIVSSLADPSNRIAVPGHIGTYTAGPGDLLAYMRRTRTGISVTLDRIEVKEP
ncbi:hypothetical protein GCM10009798_03580 [Nocardioides panacihumi]|uniref:WD40 repeat domain-containing protein n=1 Tax=Nocardioides panacihumi TaxID=400774 RepID=A0ABP5BKZ5_9ACTN